MVVAPELAVGVMVTKQLGAEPEKTIFTSGTKDWSLEIAVIEEVQDSVLSESEMVNGMAAVGVLDEVDRFDMDEILGDAN
jgi:hypothetical protein